MSPDPILTVDGLVKRFGGFRALDGVTFHLHAGEVLGLVGPNGSGKTTCINVICGLYAPDGGRVTYNGHAIAGQKSHRLVKSGINRTFQSPRPFLSLTVRENVELAAHYGDPKPGFDIDALLAQLELDRYAARPAAELNSAQQKTLDLARAMATEPRLLLVDELAAGLNPAELSRMADRLRTLANNGMALLVVEHLMGFIDKVTDRVVVMAAGKEFFGGTLADATKDPEVIRVFLGGGHHA
ncbi:MAG TPA: ABC transporter ATP-binding protein [Rhodopila sp.]|nr:ABC transporter ATP-binding protein [Rhodopila sp.]